MAINAGNVTSEAWLGGNGGQIAAGTVNVSANKDADNTFTASATAGAGAGNVGVAGGLALNALNTSVRSYLKAGASITVPGDLNLTATDVTHVVTKAIPSKDGVTGKCSNVALSLVDSVT